MASCKSEASIDLMTSSIDWLDSLYDEDPEEYGEPHWDTLEEPLIEDFEDYEVLEGFEEFSTTKKESWIDQNLELVLGLSFAGLFLAFLLVVWFYDLCKKRKQKRKYKMSQQNSEISLKMVEKVLKSNESIAKQIMDSSNKSKSVEINKEEVINAMKLEMMLAKSLQNLNIPKVIDNR